MSQFKDTFTRGKSKESLLSYDNTASLIFSSALLGFVLLPTTLRFIYKFLFPDINKFNSRLRLFSNVNLKEFKICTCEHCNKQHLKRKQEASSFSSRINSNFIKKLSIFIFLWVIFFSLVKNISVTDSIKTFDPFEILGVLQDATNAQIKKAYRHKSMKFHPDRNPNDPDAAANFILITKAYQALTDEISRNNYQKYGNPDGPGVMKVGIGLPKFLVDEDNQIVILSLFFIFLLVVLPSLFFYFYKKHSEYASNGVLVESIQIITSMLNSSSRSKSIADILAQVREFDELFYDEADTNILKNLSNYLIDCKNKRVGYRSGLCIKNHILINAHINRLHSHLTPNLNKNLNEILKHSILLTHTMLEFSLAQNWFITAKSVIEFRRSLIQCISSGDNDLLQIPHFDEHVIKHIVRGKNAARNIKEFLQQAHEDRKGMIDLTSNQINDINLYFNHFPQIKVSADAFVEGEDSIVMGDMGTIKLRIDRVNLNDGEKLGPVHAPLFPWIKFEEWWVIVTYKDEDRILAYTTFASQSKYLEDKLVFLVDRCGKVTLDIHLFCDSYYGADQHVSLTFQVKRPNEVELQSYIHPEDIDLDNVPTTIETLLGEITKPEFSDTEEYFDEETDIIKKT